MTENHIAMLFRLVAIAFPLKYWQPCAISKPVARAHVVTQRRFASYLRKGKVHRRHSAQASMLTYLLFCTLVQAKLETQLLLQRLNFLVLI